MNSPSTTDKIRSLIGVLHDPERKPISRIIIELFALLRTNKEIPVHYFTYYLFKKGMPNGIEFLPAKLAAKIPSLLNDQRLKEVLDNKLYFDLYYKQFNINLPKTILYNHERQFVSRGLTMDIDNFHDFKMLLKDAFSFNPSLDSLFVKKIYASSKGANIYKIQASQLETNPQELQKIFEEILQSEFLFQEAIKQHKLLNLLNPSSVNTLRIDTFIDENGKVNVLSGYIRMSMNNNYVDNIGSGGCMVGVDMETGWLRKYGYTDFYSNPNERLTAHPITKTVFEGFKIPFITEVKELVAKAASLMPGLRLVGWDVAIGEDGPILVEGNSDYGLRGNDMHYGGYRTHPVFKKILEEI